MFVCGQSNATAELADLIRANSGNSLNTTQNYFPGEPIRHWFDNEEPQSNLLQDCEALGRVEPDFIVWFQGEADYSIPHLYEEDFWGLYDFYLEKFPDVVFIMMQVYDHYGTCDEIRVVQQEIGVNSNIYLLDTKDYDRNDNIHLSYEGNNSLSIAIVNLIADHQSR